MKRAKVIAFLSSILYTNKNPMLGDGILWRAANKTIDFCRIEQAVKREEFRES